MKGKVLSRMRAKNKKNDDPINLSKNEKLMLSQLILKPPPLLTTILQTLQKEVE